MLDHAISAIADLHLTGTLNDAWVKTGDALAYAAGHDALAEKFYRGWSALLAVP